uniref:Uncharacterized protein n=1 Tax=Rhizophora mucronata TaxID=61149 RepID=A0A2P2QYG5_RHIMU
MPANRWGVRFLSIDCWLTIDCQESLQVYPPQIFIHDPCRWL